MKREHLVHRPCNLAASFTSKADETVAASVMVFEAVFDEFLRTRVGPCGRWQWRVFILTIIASNMAWVEFPIFTFLTPKHHCRQPFFESKGWSYDEIVRISTPGAYDVNDTETLHSSCFEHSVIRLKRHIENRNITFQEAQRYLPLIYPNMSMRSTRPCQHGWMFSQKDIEFKHSVSMDFNLVCDRKHWLIYSQVLYAIAMMAGNIFGGILSDRHGRKKIAMIFGSASFVFAIAGAVCNSIVILIVVRSVAEFFMSGTFISTDVLMCEVTDRRFRNLFIVLQSFYAIVIVNGGYTLVSYITQDWRFVQLLIALPAAISAMFGWFIEESPRWYLSKGNTARARRIIEKSILINTGADQLEKVVDMERIPVCCQKVQGHGKTLYEEQKRLCCSVPNRCHLSKCKSYFLFYHKVLAKRLILCITLFMAIAFCRFGLQHNRMHISGISEYLNYMFENFVTVPFAIIGLLVYHFFDRRRPFIAIAVIAAVLFLANGAIFTILDKDPHQDVIKLGISFKTVAIVNQYVLIGCISVMYDMITLRVIEIFPTVVRNSAYGLALGIGRLGMAAGTAQTEFLTKNYVPFCLSGTALIAALMIYLTPAEEDGYVLLDTVEQLNERLLKNHHDQPQDDCYRHEQQKKIGTNQRREKTARNGSLIDDDQEFSESSLMI